jgi:hypothetical protein
MGVEEVQDLDVDTGGQAVVAEVGLPHLVGHLGFEPQVGRAGPLARFGGDLGMAVQDPPHRRRRHRDPVMLVQVPANRLRARVEALFGQPLAQPQDQFHDAVTGRRG